MKERKQNRTLITTTIILYCIATLVSLYLLGDTLLFYFLAIGYNGGSVTGLDFIDDFKPIIIALIISLTSTTGLFKKKKFGIVAGRIGVLTLFGSIIISVIQDRSMGFKFSIEELLIILGLNVIIAICFLGLEFMNKKVNLPRRIDYTTSIIVSIFLLIIIFTG